MTQHQIDPSHEATPVCLQNHVQAYALGYDALLRDDYDASVDAFYTVVTHDPASRVGWLGLGVSLRCSGKFEMAQQVFDLLLSRNPCDLDALTYQAETLLHSGDRAQARACLQRVISLLRHSVAHRLQPMIDDLNAQLSSVGLRA